MKGEAVSKGGLSGGPQLRGGEEKPQGAKDGAGEIQ